MALQNLPIHPRNRLPQTAPQVLDSSHMLDLQFCRFFITQDFCFQFRKIVKELFGKFVKENHQKIREKHLVYGDLTMFRKIFPSTLLNF